MTVTLLHHITFEIEVNAESGAITAIFANDTDVTEFGAIEKMVLIDIGSEAFARRISDIVTGCFVDDLKIAKGHQELAMENKISSKWERT
jgi:hypothetical protein